MQSLPTFRLDKSAYYAPLPILVLGPSLRAQGEARVQCFGGLQNEWLSVRDFNVAMRALMGSDLEMFRDRPLTDFLNRVSQRVEGELVPEVSQEVLNLANSREISQQPVDTLKAIANNVVFQSHSFGAVELRCSSIGLRHQSSQELVGTTVYMEIHSMENEDRYQTMLSDQLVQQLTWEEYAISYDLILPKMEYYQEVVERHLSVLSAPGIRSVIDIGAGTGNVTVPLVKSGREVVAVDISRAMLDRLSAKMHSDAPDFSSRARKQDRSNPARQSGSLPEGPSLQDHLVLLEQSAESLCQFNDGTFDGTNILLALFDMENPQAALDEAIRTLKPGGTIVITEPKVCFAMEPILDAIVEFIESQTIDDENDAHALEDLVRSYCHLALSNRKINPRTRKGGSPLRAEKVMAILHQHGFEHVTARDSHFGQCATIRGCKPES